MQNIPLFQPNGSMNGASVPNATNSNLFAAVSNTIGALLYNFSFVLNSTVATPSQANLVTTAGGLPLLGGRVDAGAILAVKFSLQGPIFIPAGVGLMFANVLSPANIICYGSWRLLP